MLTLSSLESNLNKCGSISIRLLIDSQKPSLRVVLSTSNMAHKLLLASLSPKLLKF